MRSQYKVCVLLPTYNGSRYVVHQLQSILKQHSVEVRVFISDDLSSDATLEVIHNAFPCEERIVILSSGVRHGSGGKNFYSLIRSVDFTGFDYVSLADQDDLWELDKLESSICALVENEATAVSSDVVAFWEGGKSVYVKKSLSQKRYDYLFEPAGPGCTYLMTVGFAKELKVLVGNQIVYNDVFNHDWLIYAYARASGYRWHIMSRSTMWYRQHEGNETGVNFGLAAMKSRIEKLKSGFYLDQVHSIARAIGCADLLHKLLTNRREPSWFFLRNLFQMRRSSKLAVVWALILLLKVPR